jgi:hypothetical protein
MRCAKALTIVETKWLSTITKLNDVVGIHAVLRLCPAAPMAMRVYCLASTTSPSHHHCTPALELGCIVDRINPPWWQLGGASVEGTDERGEGEQLRHCLVCCQRPGRR